MANELYGRWVNARLTGAHTGDIRALNLKCVLCDSADYTPDTDPTTGDEFLSDIPAAARVATTANLANVVVNGRSVDADDVALPDTGGDEAEILVIYDDTGVEGTSRLIAKIDTATGLPITPDNVEDTIQWPAGGIFSM